MSQVRACGKGLGHPSRLGLTAMVLVPERGEKTLAITVEPDEPAAVAVTAAEGAREPIGPPWGRRA